MRWTREEWWRRNKIMRMGKGKGLGADLLELEAVGTLTQDAEPGGTALVDARNGFNELRRLEILWTVRHRWRAGTRFALN